jgi:hypothetical protein
VDNRNTGMYGIERILWLVLFPSKPDFAGIFPIGPRKDLDQRGLAGPVLAE